MNRLFAFALSGLIVGLAGFAGAADDKDDFAKKIVAKWECTKQGSVPEGSIVEFTKDGKLIASIKGIEQKIEGTYKVEKDKINVKLKDGDQSIEETVTILKLTDEALELKDKDSKVDVFKKVK